MFGESSSDSGWYNLFLSSKLVNNFSATALVNSWLWLILYNSTTLAVVLPVRFILVSSNMLLQGEIFWHFRLFFCLCSTLLVHISSSNFMHMFFDLVFTDMNKKEKKMSDFISNKDMVKNVKLIVKKYSVLY